MSCKVCINTSSIGSEVVLINSIQSPLKFTGFLRTPWKSPFTFYSTAKDARQKSCPNQARNCLSIAGFASTVQFIVDIAMDITENLGFSEAIYSFSKRIYSSCHYPIELFENFKKFFS